MRLGELSSAAGYRDVVAFHAVEERGLAGALAGVENRAEFFHRVDGLADLVELARLADDLQVGSQIHQ